MYGSFVNSISEAGDGKWKVGDGATILMYSDRHAATVVAVSASGREVAIQADHAKRVDKNGMSENQTYEFSPNHEARRVTYTLRKNGRWVVKGQDMHSGQSLGRGRSEYYDFTR